MTPERRFSLAGVAALLMAVPLVAAAQTAPDTPKLFYACYGSLTGVVYRIKEPGLPTGCLHRTHVEFSWTSGNAGAALTDHGALQGLGNDDHPQYLLGDGSRALTGALSVGGHKLTNLDAATAAGEAVRFEQAVKSGDAAGGDLSGTYPTPTVAKLQGAAVSSTAPTNGQVLAFNGTSWAPAESPTGGGGTTGQNSVTLFGTGSLQVLPGGASEAVPGLTTTINVLPNSVTIVTTHGGATLLSAGDRPTDVEIKVLIDGATSDGGFRWLRVLDLSPSAVQINANWSMQFAVRLTPGSHTIEVRARNFSSQLQPAFLPSPIVSGGAGSGLQGTLTLTTLKL
jgi:hypothetical protein